jgi:hypothetical protein
MLSIYDVLVHGLSNRFAWRCPTQRLLDLYRANLSADHLETGVGTGFLLDRTGDGRLKRLVTLLDLYNAKGVFDNREDDLPALSHGLRQRLARVEVELLGCVALFRAV